jgi:hypothetical protein
MRWTSNGSYPSIIGANQVYSIDGVLTPEIQTNTASTSLALNNYTLSNVRAKGISGNLFRIVPLQNYADFTIDNVWIEK